MLVNDCMTRHPILIAPTMLATEAQRILTENNIRHLPVVGAGKRLEGLVTQQSFQLDPEMVGSLNVWDISRYLADLQVRQVMAKAKDVVTIRPERTAERAARLMMDHKVSCLPVVEDGDVVVGVLTEVDLLYAFQTMLALPEEGIRVTVRMPNKKGEFAKLTAVLGQHEIGVMGVGTYPTPRREGYYDCVLKIRNVTEEQVRAALGQIPEQEIVDLRTAV
jgi:acetoin utilization protein AcuB